MRHTFSSNQQTPVWVLIGVNVFLFLVSIIFPDMANFMALRLITFPSYPWAIVTAMFMHGGFWHLLANMLTLYFFGTFLIQLVGKNKFLLVYFIGGITGNVFFLLASQFGIGANPYVGVVGASGAIYALGGALAVITPKLKVYLFGIVPMPLWLAIILGIIIVSPGIAWQAHLGGLVSGVVAGIIFRQRRMRYYF